jgi:hypothetical protein
MANDPIPGRDSYPVDLPALEAAIANGETSGAMAFDADGVLVPTHVIRAMSLPSALWVAEPGSRETEFRQICRDLDIPWLVILSHRGGATEIKAIRLPTSTEPGERDMDPASVGPWHAILILTAIGLAVTLLLIVSLQLLPPPPIGA